MGLFRRGTKLLKLGSGLRDCCCRPEKPEECWCPDWCRFSWYWPGMDVVSLTRTFKSVSCIPFDAKTFPSLFGDLWGFPAFDPPYGLITNTETFIGPFSLYSASLGVVAVPDTFTFNETGFNVLHSRLGGVDEPYVVVQNWPLRLCSYFTSFWTVIYCVQETQSLRLSVTLNQTVTLENEPRSGASAVRKQLYRFSGFVDVDLPSVCVNDLSLQCDQSRSEITRHPESPLEIQVDQLGVTFNGTTTSWQPLLGSSVFEFDGDSWEVENEYPLATTVTLTVASCQAAPCDCNAVLSGIPVQFEGREFTYGAGDEFLSDDGATRWVESSPGLFYRYDYDPCDYSQQFVANQKTANVFCTNVDGQDYWGVVLTNECYERSSCGGGYDAARTVQWSGLFSCSEGGFPEGFPHSASDAADPPDFLFDIPSDPAPTEECAGDVAIPSFRFLAND